jgi:hypothetical protein
VTQHRSKCKFFSFVGFPDFFVEISVTIRFYIEFLVKRSRASRPFALTVTLLGFAGGEFLPLPRSKGAAFPSRSPATGSPTVSARVAHRQDALPILRKLRFFLFVVDDIDLSNFLLLAYGVGNATGDHGRTLSTHIGEFKGLMVSIVNEALTVTGLTVVPVGVERMEFASFYTFETLNPRFLKAEFSLGQRRRVQRQICHEASDPAGTPLFCNKQVVEAKSPNTSCIGHMAV